MPLLAAPSIHSLTTIWASPGSSGRLYGFIPARPCFYYDEWWLSIILTWKHPLFFWLGVANEAKLPFLSLHSLLYSRLLSYLLSLLFLCQWALRVLSSGACKNSQTSCREGFYGVFLCLWPNAAGKALAASRSQMGMRCQAQLYHPWKDAQLNKRKAVWI